MLTFDLSCWLPGPSSLIGKLTDGTRAGKGTGRLVPRVAKGEVACSNCSVAIDWEHPSLSAVLSAPAMMAAVRVCPSLTSIPWEDRHSVPQCMQYPTPLRSIHQTTPIPTACWEYGYSHGCIVNLSVSRPQYAPVSSSCGTLATTILSLFIVFCSVPTASYSF